MKRMIAIACLVAAMFGCGMSYIEVAKVCPHQRVAMCNGYANSGCGYEIRPCAVCEDVEVKP